MNNSLFNTSLISVSPLSKSDVELIFQKADEMKQLVQKNGGDDRLKGKIMAALFYEPSSRTIASFVASMQRLGGGIIPIGSMKVESSVAKGETLRDTAKVFSSYADILVVRHNEVGAPKQLGDAASVPVINAGDGSGEHPTQAILDCYTINDHFSDFSKLRIGLIGDLLYGRTVHSLSQLLCSVGVKQFVFISPPQLQMPMEITKKLEHLGGNIKEVDSLDATVSHLDVLYSTRVQKERFDDLSEYEKLKHAYIITPEVMKKVKKQAVLMHPLPRVGEILESVDDDPRALYFREQMRNGMYVRMAILDLILRNE